MSTTVKLLLLILFIFTEQLCNGKRIRKDLELDCVPETESEDSEEIALFEEDTYRITGLSNQEGTRVTVADDFDVIYSSTFKIVDNLKINETYVLYSCGTKKPNLKDLKLEHAKLFEIPLTSVSLYDGTSAGFMNLLNISDRVTYTSEYAVDSCYQKIRNRCGRISQDPMSEYADPDLVKEQDEDVDAIFHYSASENKKTIGFTATMDPSPLNRAEWIKFISVFFNKEVDANGIFDQIVKDWDKLKNTISKNRKKPLVAWINYQDFDTREFIINNDTYKMDYIKGAGGKTLKIKDLLKIEGIEEVSDGAAIKIKDKEFSKAAKALGKAIKDVDIIIDETYAAKPNKYTLTTFFDNFGISADDEYKFLKNLKIYRLDGLLAKGTYSDSLDWFENAVARPDLVLKDFLEAFETSKKHDDHKRIWLRNIAWGEKAKKIKGKHCEIEEVCDIVPEVICPSVVLSCDDTLVLRDPLNNTCSPAEC